MKAGYPNECERTFVIKLTGQGEIPVTFVDANLEAAVRLILMKPTGVITDTDMETLTNVDLSGLALTDLSGLEFAVNLNILNIRNNAFTDAFAVWQVLDQLDLYCLYIDFARPSGDGSGLTTETVSDTGGNNFFNAILT